MNQERRRRAARSEVQFSVDRGGCDGFSLPTSQLHGCGWDQPIKWFVYICTYVRVLSVEDMGKT